MLAAETLRAGGTAKWYSYFGRLTISYKTKYTPSNHTPSIQSRVENLYPHKNLHNVPNDFIYQCQNLEQ